VLGSGVDLAPAHEEALLNIVRVLAMTLFVTVTILAFSLFYHTKALRKSKKFDSLDDNEPEKSGVSME
jgi:hypothetical protein